MAYQRPSKTATLYCYRYTTLCPFITVAEIYTDYSEIKIYRGQIQIKATSDFGFFFSSQNEHNEYRMCI